ncbi:MAG: hypothetical protein ABI999_12515 [Acidobacteriota bacterium]
MRKREVDIVAGKLGNETDQRQGRPMCIRPYHSDEKKLDEIAKETGEAKAAVVRRMIRFALSDKQQNFAANQCRDKLDWLIKNGQVDTGRGTILDSRIEEILERIGSLENPIENMSDILHQLAFLLREIYCLSSISFSSQNLIFTRLLEFSSPDAEERQQSVILAAAALGNQIAQAVKDLNKLEAFHRFNSDEAQPHDLYVLTKIKAIQDLIAAQSLRPSDKPPGSK